MKKRYRIKLLHFLCFYKLVAIILMSSLFVEPAWSDNRIGPVLEEEENWQKLFLREMAPLLNKKEATFSLLLRYQNNQDRLYPLAYATTSREITLNAALQIGISDRTELTLKAPLSWVESNTVMVGNERNSSKFDVGDLSFDFKVLVLEENDIRPDIICSIGASIPTGTNPYSNDVGTGLGHWFVFAGITLVKSFDPVVLFGNISYSYVFEESYDSRNYKPGDVINYSWGLGIVLNRKLTVSGEILGAYQDSLKADPQLEIATFSSEAISLRYGATCVLSKNFTLGSFVTFGLNDSASDATIDLSFIWKFK